MTTTTFTFNHTRPINDQFETFVSNFEKDAPLLPVELRVLGVEALTEAYFNHVGKHAPIAILTRLSTTLQLTVEEQQVLNEADDDHDYTTLNDRQMERREQQTISDRAAFASAADGQSYLPPINIRRKGRLYE